MTNPKLQDIPIEVFLDHLLPSIDLPDLLSLAQTNKFFAVLCADDTFWKLKLKDDYNFSNTDARNKGAYHEHVRQAIDAAILVRFQILVSRHQEPSTLRMGVTCWSCFTVNDSHLTLFSGKRIVDALESVILHMWHHNVEAFPTPYSSVSKIPVLLISPLAGGESRLSYSSETVPKCSHKSVGQLML